jgi:hypothetical protein
VPVIAVEAARLLSIGNFSQFSAAIGAAADAPQELKACRNYLAHRHKGTATHANINDLRIRIGVPVKVAGAGALAAQIVTGNITLFEEWCIELSNIASAAIS